MADFNALNPVNNINSYAEYFNNHGTKIKPELFYDKQLLDTIRLGADQFVFYRLAQTKGIQNGAKKLQVRRWAPLHAHTVPLVEGVPPQSDKGSMESFELDTHAYGRYMEFSDRVNFEVIDPVIAHYTAEYSVVALETLDLLAQEALESVAQAYYANAKSSISQLTLADKPELADLRVIINTMKKLLVKPRSGNRYMVIATPDFSFDMVSDPLVEKYMTINQTTKPYFDDPGPIPPMFGMEFYETMNSSTSSEYFDSVANDYKLVVYRWNTNTSAYQYTTIAAATYKVAGADNYRRDSRTGEKSDYVPGLKEWDLDAFNDTIIDGYGEYKELKINRIYVLGADALVRTEIAGQGNAKMYVKPLGSAGVLDPIDQRQSIGFKINSVGFGNVIADAVVIYHCVPSQTNI